MIDDDGRRLPLDKRWTNKERYRYAKALEAGDFTTALRIMESRMTPEQVEAAQRQAAEWLRIFGGLA